MKNIPLFDGHCDTVLAMGEKGAGLYENNLHVDIKRGMKYAPYVQTFAMFAFDDFENNYRRSIDLLKSELDKNAEYIALCKNADDIKRCTAQGKAAAIISAEGAELLGCDENKLKAAKEEGISFVNITWNYENALSGSNAENPEKGLTGKGKSFVKKCEEAGILVDVSHISDPAFWDVAETVNGPFIASHSDFREIHNHKRNLTDAQFKEIINHGGVAGINMYSDFIGDSCDISAVIKHIDRALKLGGEKNIAIGCDFDGCDTLPDGICGIEDLEKVYNELIKLGYGEKLAENIFFNNFFAVIEKVL